MRTIIIAEAGVNHNGNLELAKEMIYKAKDVGADYVKFQTAIPELVISKNAPKADYQLVTTSEAESQLDMAKAIHLPIDAYALLKKICDQIGIRFLSTPFDLVSIDCLATLDMDFFKIPSGEITNLPYLIAVAKTGKPVILSTGMSVLEEIKKAVEILKQNGSGEITVLHCNTEYPTPYEDVNLRAMLTIQRELGLKTGYSDHTPGIEVPIAAVALGATVIEKHFTLDRNMEGPDHKASLEPAEFAAMVKAIRSVEKALGSYEKTVSASESKNKNIARKSIVAAKSIAKGEALTEANLTVKRPGNGISPMEWYNVIGKTALRDFEEDEQIEL
ncbi:MAG: N-acetylneuraminate synthase [Candidatus Azobacteroides sp.]|nr:N-acetylneuraminate synthase [Candidatus Azobacteroides sp.]